MRLEEECLVGERGCACFVMAGDMMLIISLARPVVMTVAYQICLAFSSYILQWHNFVRML